MSKDEVNDIVCERDCGKCVWRSESGCTEWDCNYMSRTELREILKANPGLRSMSLKHKDKALEVKVKKKEYMRKYYADNKDKWDEYRRRYWEKRLNEGESDE